MEKKTEEFDILVGTRPPARTVGIKVRTNMEHASRDCPALWQTFAPRMREIAGTGLGESYGISVMAEGLDGGACVFDYWAALPVGDHTPLPQGMEECRLPGGEYAYFEIPSLQRLAEGYAWFYETWLPGQSYSLDLKAPCFELYPADYLRTGRIVLYFGLIKK